MNVLGGTHRSICFQTEAQLVENSTAATGNFLHILRTWRWKSLAALPETCSASPGTGTNPALFLGNFSSKKLLLSHGTPEIAQCEPQGLLSLGGVQQEDLDRPFQSRILENQHTFEPCYIFLATMTFK